MFNHDFRPLLHIFPSFSLTYKLQSHISKYQVFHALIAKSILIKIFFLNSWRCAWLWSYGPQTTQMNEKASLGIILRFDTNLAPLWWKSWTMRGVPSFQSWTPLNLVLSNFFKLLYLGDLFQIDHTFGNEFEIVYESFYKIENTSIFAWFSILDIGHYCWLHNLICRLPLNNKVDYLIFTIQQILNFL